MGCRLHRLVYYSICIQIVLNEVEAHSSQLIASGKPRALRRWARIQLRLLH